MPKNSAAKPEPVDVTDQMIAAGEAVLFASGRLEGGQYRDPPPGSCATLVSEIFRAMVAVSAAVIPFRRPAESVEARTGEAPSKTAHVTAGSVDPSHYDAAFAELRRLVSLFPPDRIDEIGCCLNAIRERPHDLLVSVGRVVSADGTLKYVVSLKPSEFFLELLAAIRTRQEGRQIVDGGGADPHEREGVSHLQRIEGACLIEAWLERSPSEPEIYEMTTRDLAAAVYKKMRRVRDRR